MNDKSTGADVGTVVAWLGYLTSHLVDATPLLQAIALLVAIISGICAAYYHIRKANQL